jgi:hypothetical protein
VVITLALAIAVANLAIDLLRNRYRGRDQGKQTDHAMIAPTPAMAQASISVVDTIVKGRYGATAASI